MINKNLHLVLSPYLSIVLVGTERESITWHTTWFQRTLVTHENFHWGNLNSFSDVSISATIWHLERCSNTGQSSERGHLKFLLGVKWLNVRAAQTWFFGIGMESDTRFLSLSLFQVKIFSPTSSLFPFFTSLIMTFLFSLTDGHQLKGLLNIFFASQVH